MCSYYADVASPTFRGYPAKRSREYVPNYDWGAAALSDRHERIADAVWHIPGWLEPEDALKLYELAYFASGPIIEIGSYCGRSAVVIATALVDRRTDVPFVSLDTDAAVLPLAHRAARAHGVEQAVVFVCASARGFFQTFPGFGPRLIFVDADHSAAGVEADLAALDREVDEGALILFHDYLRSAVPDTRGFPISPEPIEVAETVDASWVARRTEFTGTFGCSALFRVTSPPI